MASTITKKIAQYDLEIKTDKILNKILHLRYEIQKNYIACLYNQEHLRLVKEITKVIHSLKKNRLYYTFGYTNDLDKLSANSKLGIWETKIMEHENNLQQSYIDLYEVLGGNISTKPVELLDILNSFAVTTSLKKLEDFALSSHPIILIEKSKISRAENSIRYEKSKIFDSD